VKPRKEGFGKGGKWVWVPAGGATVLELVVNNETNKRTPPDNKEASGGGDDGDNGNGRGVDQTQAPESGSGAPEGDDVA
jgi:hypothetical protein